MSNVIEFLERMGQDSRLHDATRAEVCAALAETGIGAAEQAAILAAGRHGIADLLKVPGKTYCLIEGFE